MFFLSDSFSHRAMRFAESKRDFTEIAQVFIIAYTLFENFSHTVSI